MRGKNGAPLAMPAVPRSVQPSSIYLVLRFIPKRGREDDMGRVLGCDSHNIFLPILVTDDVGGRLITGHLEYADTADRIV